MSEILTVRRSAFLSSFVLSWFILLTTCAVSSFLIREQRKPQEEVSVPLLTTNRIATQKINEDGSAMVLDSEVSVKGGVETGDVISQASMAASALTLSAGARDGAILVLRNPTTGETGWSTTLSAGNVATNNAVEPNVLQNSIVVFQDNTGIKLKSIPRGVAPVVNENGGLVFPITETGVASMAFRGGSYGLGMSSDSRLQFIAAELGLMTDRESYSGFSEKLTFGLSKQTTLLAPVPLLQLKPTGIGSELLKRTGSLGCFITTLVFTGFQHGGQSGTFSSLPCSVQFQWNVELRASVVSDTRLTSLVLGSQTSSAAYFVSTPRFQWVEQPPTTSEPTGSVALMYTFASVPNPPATLTGTVSLVLSFGVDQNDASFGFQIQVLSQF